MGEDQFSVLLQAIQAMRSELSVLAQNFYDHTATEEEAYRKITTELSRVSVFHKAFPHNENGEPDVEGHKLYHVEKIDDFKTSKKRVEKIKDKVIDILVSGTLVLLLVIMGLGIKDWLHELMNSTPTEISKSIRESVKP